MRQKPSTVADVVDTIVKPSSIRRKTDRHNNVIILHMICKFVGVTAHQAQKDLNAEMDKRGYKLDGMTWRPK